jgi:hypothetical protein
VRTDSGYVESMSGQKNADAYYRRAQEARRDALRVTTPSLKETFLRTAQQYEQMAVEAALPDPRTSEAPKKI